jgi:hypothetical protein
MKKLLTLISLFVTLFAISQNDSVIVSTGTGYQTIKPDNYGTVDLVSRRIVVDTAFNALLIRQPWLTSSMQDPVSWSFSATKMRDRIYEVHLKATIQRGWHLFSQEQPEDAIAIPTTFTVNKNPIFAKRVGFDERGNLEKFHDKKLKVSANQYSDSVDFVMIVELKANVVTNVAGNVEYQTCNDEKCLPPRKQAFSITLQ